MVNNNWEYLYQSELNLKKRIKVACVLAYYNGSAYFKDQLQSIINQIQKSFSLTIFISDDNSVENFPSLDYLIIDKTKNLNILYRKLSKNIGYAKNFIYSLSSIPPEFDYYCFSDQDDIWLDNKIEGALKKIDFIINNKPILYGGRTTYYDTNCKREIGYSLLFKKKPSFRNAIIQNIAGGNTMLFNKAARNVIVKSINETFDIVSHDWWCYQIITGAGGYFYYDKKSFIKYRQHGKNLLGANNSIKAKLDRILSLLIGKFKIYYNIHLSTLEKNKSLLTKENQLVLKILIKGRNQSFLKRTISFLNIGIYRQTIFGNLALFFAILLKRL